MKLEALGQWRVIRRRRRLMIASAFLLLLALIVAGAVLFTFLRPSAPGTGLVRQALPQVTRSSTIPLNLPPPDLLRPITPQEALAENSKRAFSGRPDTPAAGFTLKTDEASRDRALECMTQAVYYEAATEGADGQRAVAQVILNRMHHPAYPNTVCGVVYQGSDRPTGCQFTFTCDGSLARVPAPSLWKQAQKIAAQALAGKVFAPVGHATHYHADYVLPYWADSLDKSVQVGRHIFYRLKAGLGSSAAFRQRYGGREPEPPPPSTVAVALEAVQNADPMAGAPTENLGAQAPVGELVASAQPKPDLLADQIQGTLLIDGSARPVGGGTSSASSNSGTCGGSAGGKPLRPMSANDVRAKGSGPGC